MGLVVFVHGGFWMRLDKSFWSHLARGSVESGYAVAMPVLHALPGHSHRRHHREIAAAIAQAAAMIAGPDPADGSLRRRTSGHAHDFRDIAAP